MTLDIIYMVGMASRVTWQAHSVYGYPVWAVGLAVVATYAAYRRTGKAPFEGYTEAHKNAHVVFHGVAIGAITLARTDAHEVLRTAMHGAQYLGQLWAGPCIDKIISSVFSS